MSNSLLISPHDDDQALFAAFTCLRHKPTVVIVTDSYIQPQRGEVGCDVETRATETLNACKILGCPVVRLGIRDDTVDEWTVLDKLVKFQNFDRIYGPAIQGGSPHHDIVGSACMKVFGPYLKQYTTYTKTQLWTPGNTEVIPTEEELDLKRKALACYTSQVNLSSTKPHFEAVDGRSEWLI
jgi:LmbE family N-acetylglucosaminyl deacetylase